MLNTMFRGSELPVHNGPPYRRPRITSGFSTDMSGQSYPGLATTSTTSPNYVVKGRQCWCVLSPCPSIATAVVWRRGLPTLPVSPSNICTETTSATDKTSLRPCQSLCVPVVRGMCMRTYLRQCRCYANSEDRLKRKGEPILGST